MQNYESDELIAVDFKKYISEKMSEDVDLSALYSELNGNSEMLKVRMENEIADYLDDESLYYDKIENGNIHYISVDDVRVDFVTDDVYINESNDKTIDFELEIHVNYRVEISYDDYTNATYDNEDKEWYGAEYTSEDFIESGSTVVCMKFDKQSKDIEITEADYADLLW